ncbi:MAG: hypothetical protein JNM59_08335 [Hyphomonadaceae bacterium]|nr:hypothetical protein [Hyphomonadaceae bacterium]
MSPTAPNANSPARALIIGHFSTVGDIESLEAVKDWCASAGLPFDIAPYSKSLQARMDGAISPAQADPLRYSHVIVVCGPCYEDLLHRNGVRLEEYQHCHKIGVNLTMVAPLAEWNPFDVLVERDSDRATRADLTFTRPIERGSVVGRCVVKRQREYGARQRHNETLALIDDLIRRRNLASIEIATDWPSASTLVANNSSTILSSILSRVDVLLTNRLHGFVYALRNGVPVLAIDAVAGGDKLTRQARALGWPVCLQADTATTAEIDRSFAWCLSEEARSAAKAVSAAAMEAARAIEEEAAAALVLPPKPRPARLPPRSAWELLFRR